MLEVTAVCLTTAIHPKPLERFMGAKNDLSAEYVRSILSYDPETGEFRFLIRKGGRGSVGKIAGSFDKKKYRLIDNSFLHAKQLCFQSL